MFGEAVLQPADDIAGTFSDEHGADAGGGLTARHIEEDPNFGWGCMITDDDLNEVEAQDFLSENELRTWLTEQEVAIDG